ncbi:MAG: DUF1800 domain-containing protein [Planctomycetes bacterium]|nr:DUF1800 domain-containing protein [Planctomycetota bacterium]
MTRRDRSNDPLCPYDAGAMGWTRREATHLLWRTQFGATEEDIERALSAGLEQTVERLVTPQPESQSFQRSDHLLRQIAEDTGNIQDLKAWWINRMLHSANPLVERMSLFWHSHFATSNLKVRSVRHMAAQNDLIRGEALGHFSVLLSGMARDVAMLIWLDSNANRKRHANENFSREVMELFALDVGHYSERDISEAARAFTGWHVRNDRFWFNRRQHDFGQKTVLGRTGDLDGEDVIALCLAQPACPRFLARKLLHAFVTSDPGEEDVDALASSIRRHDFHMAPVLRELLLSQLFFRQSVRHALIKSPADFVLGAYRATAFQANLQQSARLLARLGQDLFAPPTVKGWEGGRLWISSSSLLQRTNFVAKLVANQNLGIINEPKGSDQLVQHYIELLLSGRIDETSSARLVRYVNEADRQQGTGTRGLIHLIMTMPEYQLM